MIIDEKDRHLLTLLQRNARASVTELSAATGMARATVKTRIAALQTSGVIKRFTVDIDQSVVAEDIRAISLIASDGQKPDGVQRALGRLPQVSQLYTTNGAWDLVAETTSATLAEFDATLTKINAVAGVKSVETCLLLTRVKTR